MCTSLENITSTQQSQAADIERLKASASEHDSVSFKVAQYNILAGYLGDNRQPWFMYGVDLTQERRAAIMTKFYEKGPDGKYANAGWPKYVVGILSDEEMRAIEEVHESVFSWERRRPALLRVIEGWEADLISLVECDHYHSFFKPQLEQRGYGSVYKRRPRPSSDDGCAIFFRKGVFRLVASTALEFVDKYDPKTGQTYKDRVGLVALLEHVSGRRLTFISTHLARNPEDPTQTKSRAKQTAQLLKGLTDFADTHGALDEPALLAGDLNTTNIRQIADIARTVFELCRKPAHPFMFSAAAPPSLPTSVTTTRRMCIDYLFMQSSISVIEQAPMQSLSMSNPIPNAEHPSDHLPIVFTLAFRANATQLEHLARMWALVVLGSVTSDLADLLAHAQPIHTSDMTRAFAYFDAAGDGVLCPHALEAGLSSLGMPSRVGALTGAVEHLIGRAISVEAPLPFAEFEDAFLAAFLMQKQGFVESMRDAFAYFDSSGDGRLEHDELYASFRDACPFEVEQAHFTQMFNEIDANGDGTVSLDEFIHFLVKSQTSGRKSMLE